MIPISPVDPPTTAKSPVGEIAKASSSSQAAECWNLPASLCRCVPLYASSIFIYRELDICAAGGSLTGKHDDRRIVHDIDRPGQGRVGNGHCNSRTCRSFRLHGDKVSGKSGESHPQVRRIRSVPVTCKNHFRSGDRGTLRHTPQCRPEADRCDDELL